ncbi:hypothetical protein [uncultured Methylibium sp.]|uniref:hypothetical protein n=1 Tax=uncultured Methylibium sp. TaxID=381093 RepID=UPI0025EE38DF|nr:hypothetical protein [uncultured Methylibium sp.]
MPSDLRSSPAAALLEPLAPGTTVGSFVLHEVSSRDEFSLRYRATASASAAEVTIEEFAPAAISLRRDDGTLWPRSPAQAALWTEGRRAFVQEAERFALVGHSSLQALGPVWNTPASAYRIRAWVGGPTLAAARGAMAGPPTEDWLRRLLAPMLDALHALHQAGGLHGHVQPHGVRLRAEATPVLTDPAAVRLAIGDRMPHLPPWPFPAFVASELRSPEPGLSAGPWSDLYAVAALARFCITGSMDGEADRAWTRIPAAGSAAFVAVIERALADDPRERPQSVVEFRRDLEAAVARQPLRGAPASSEMPAAPRPVTLTGEVDDEPQLPVWPRNGPGDGATAGLRSDTRGFGLEPTLDEVVGAGMRAPIVARMAPRSSAMPGSARPQQTRRWPAAVAGAVVGAALTLAATQGSHLMDTAPLALSWISGLTARGDADRPPKDATVVTTPAAAPPAAPAAPPAAPAAVATASSDAASLAPLSVPAVQAAREPVAAPVPQPAAAPSPPPRAIPPSRVASLPPTPSAACAPRTAFALYRCMKQQCESTRYFAHPQCVRLRATDELP